MSWAPLQILLDLRAAAPRDAEHPVEVVAHDGRLRGHGRHLAELLQFAERLLAGFLRELGLLDLVFELGQLVAAVLVAELLLDRLHLLVEVVLALRLLHLTLHAGADPLLDLQDGDFALHQAEHLLEPLGDRRDLEDRLLVGDLDGEMRGDRIGELRRLVDLGHRRDDLGRDLLVELHVVLELGDHRAGKRLRLDLVAERIGKSLGLGLVEVLGPGIGLDVGPARALDQHLHGAVGQLQELQHARQGSDLVDRVRRRIVVRGVDLGRKQDVAVGLDHLLQGTDRLLPADEERHDHVREDDDVPQRQNRIGPGRARHDGLAWL